MMLFRLLNNHCHWSMRCMYYVVAGVILALSVVFLETGIGKIENHYYHEPEEDTVSILLTNTTRSSNKRPGKRTSLYSIPRGFKWDPSMISPSVWEYCSYQLLQSSKQRDTVWNLRCFLRLWYWLNLVYLLFENNGNVICKLNAGIDLLIIVIDWWRCVQKKLNRRN